MVADPTNFVNQVSCTAYIDSSSWRAPPLTMYLMMSPYLLIDEKNRKPTDIR
jgi:hypothetical protein